MTELAKNQVHTVTVEGYGGEGMGVARIGGRVVFVRGALRAEKCEIIILKVLKSVAFAKVQKILEPSGERVTPDCPYFPRCGGCTYRHMSYGEELRLKKQRVQDALARIGGSSVAVEEILGGEDILRYRNKAQYPVSADGAVGFYRARSHDVVAGDRCRIQHPAADQTAGAVRAWMARWGVSGYDEKTGRGLVRHVYVRVNRQGQSLCCLLVNGKKLPREAELVEVSKQNMPLLMIPDIDVLVVQDIGKDISGNGYDPNILGKSFLLKEFVLPVPKIDRMVVLDVSPASHGSAVGIGIFDVTTRKLFDQLNMEAMYANDIALGCLDDCKIPLVAADEEEAIRVAVKVLQDNDPEKLKIVRIRDTLHMEEIQGSEDLLDVVKAGPRLELLGPV